jgi:hypothetical protein
MSPLLETFANASVRGFETFGPAGSSNSYELISTVIASGSVSTISFSSIPSTYKHLQIRGAVRTASSSANTGCEITFNGDTGGNYSWHTLAGNGSGAYSEGQTSQSYITTNSFAGNGSTTGDFGAIILDIFDYANTSKNTTTRLMGGHTSDLGRQIRFESGLWFNTAAVTTVQFKGYSSLNYVVGSRFSLYGIKG